MGDEISNIEWMRMLESAEEELRQTEKKLKYQKYKRCLAMADYCFARSVAEDVLHTNKDGIEHADYWIRRHKMWLELAEKFKEAK